MLANLPDELLMNIEKYCSNIDWKHLMDTSNELFRDLKYRTINVCVDFNMLNDRVLPPIVGKLMNPLEQLNLYLDTEESLDMDTGIVEVKKSWEHKGKWRRNKKNLITMTDIKWFISIPAKALKWRFAGPLLEKHNTLMKALRKYKILYLDINYYSKTYLPYDKLNHSKDIKTLIIDNSYDFVAPVLPSLIQFQLINDSAEVSLKNFIYSSSLKRIYLRYCKYGVIIPKQLKERGVIINRSDTFSLKLKEVDVEQNNNHENDQDDGNETNDNLNDDSSNIYDEDEVTVYEDCENEDDDEGNAQYYSD